VQTVPLPRNLVDRLDLDVNSGILIVGVEPDGPAHRAGVEEGDVIVGFDDRPVAGIDDLHRLLTEERVGLWTRVDLIRDGDRLTLNLIPQESRG
jgi:S1-C subfamily serine protease